MSDDLPSVDELLAEFLSLYEQDPEASFERWLEGHPEHEGELRRAHGDWLDGMKLIGRALGEPPGRRLVAGATLGEFELVSHLGRGGQGVVWEATQPSVGGRHVALKLLHPDRLSDSSVSRFAREARAGGRLSHPGIVTVFGSGEADERGWIAMELVPGGRSLRDRIVEAASRLDVPAGYDQDVARFVAEVADAMQTAHDAGVIHRDLKPQNILITPDDRPKVTDFGLARLTDESAISQSGELAGTYFYMSPEQVAAKRAGIDHRTDVFSLGVVLYELLTFQRPFQGDTSQQIASQIVNKDPLDPRTIRSRIPRELAVIAGKAMEKERGRRYGSMTELAADLRRFLSDEPIIAQPPTAWDRTVKWTRRNPAKSTASAVATVAFVVISVLLVDNIRAKRDLQQTNADLALQTSAAREAAAREKERADEVLRLAAAQHLEDLLVEAEGLWPPRPERIPLYRDWIERARKLLADLPLHVDKLQELRALALQQPPGERQAERESHPDFGRIALLEEEIAWRKGALAVRRGEEELSLPVIDRSDLPEYPGQCHWLAWECLKPERTRLGNEARGLAIALTTLPEVPAEARFSALNAIAWGYFAVGADDLALTAAFDALESAPDDYREAMGRDLDQISAEVEEAQSAEGLAASANKLEPLQEELAALRVRVGERRTWRFPDDDEYSPWWHAQLARLISGLERLNADLLVADATTPEQSWSVARRLQFAMRLESELAAGGELDVRWQRALPAIREAYPGLDLRPQAGLVPIGPDPNSKLWEFAHLATGSPPVRGEDEALVLTEDMGVVLVLIPAGTYWMGAQTDDEKEPYYDPHADMGEMLHEVELDAYFLSKFEMTQGQWKRLMGENPSNYGCDAYWESAALADRGKANLLHPVEQVSWYDCRGVLTRFGLELPTEAQWEIGCRGETPTPWWPGMHKESLRGVANLADSYAFSHGAADWVFIQDWLNDGATLHAPIGTYAPNPFGLHELHGNVGEWCLDTYDADYYAGSSRANPVNRSEATILRVYRGGTFAAGALEARSSLRAANSAADGDGSQGVRPARVVEQ